MALDTKTFLSNVSYIGLIFNEAEVGKIFF
jgi:hypothetical protein